MNRDTIFQLLLLTLSVIVALLFFLPKQDPNAQLREAVKNNDIKKVRKLVHVQ